MAGPFTKLLSSVAQGFLTPKGQLADWQHASRVFVDDNFRLAPKSKFNFHCYFDINKSAVFHQQLMQRHQGELGLVVKQIDLPRFQIRNQTLNQYNRKKVVQTGHTYQPINVRFHDDRSHIVNILWQAYYKYYYADPTTATVSGAYKRNSLSSFSMVKGSHGYDNNSSIPFFNSIIIYQMSKKEYVSYTLINPMITSFNHDQMMYASQGENGSECSMTIAYEAVTYDMGAVSSKTVKGFASSHYDKLPSPLTAAGGGTASLLGTGGVLEGAASVIGSISSGQAFNSLDNLVNTAATAVNTYQNAKNLSGAGVKQEAVGLATGLAVGAAGVGINALRGTFFPQGNAEQKTQATPYSSGNVPGGV